MDSAKKRGDVIRRHRALSIAEKVEELKEPDSVLTYAIGSSTVKKKQKKNLKLFSGSGSKKQYVRFSSGLFIQAMNNYFILLKWNQISLELFYTFGEN